MTRKSKANVFDEMINSVEVPDDITAEQVDKDLADLENITTSSKPEPKQKKRFEVIEEEDEDLDEEDEELEREIIIEDIMSIQVSFHSNLFPVEKLQASSLKSLKAKRKLLMRKLDKSQDANFEQLILKGTLHGVEMIASKLGINLSEPYPLTENVLNDPKINLILKQIGLSSKVSEAVQNPYAQIALISSLSAVDIVFKNKNEKAPYQRITVNNPTFTVTPSRQPEPKQEPKPQPSHPLEEEEKPEKAPIVITYCV